MTIMNGLLIYDFNIILIYIPLMQLLVFVLNYVSSSWITKKNRKNQNLRRDSVSLYDDENPSPRSRSPTSESIKSISLYTIFGNAKALHSFMVHLSKELSSL